MVGSKFSLFATMGKSFGSGVVVWMLMLLVAGMIEAKCLDGNGNITIGSCTIAGTFSPDVENFNSDGGDAYKSPINIVANSAGVTLQQNSKTPISVCSIPPFKLGADGKAAINFSVHIDSADFVEFDLDPSIQIVSSSEAKTNYWITIGIPVGVGLIILLILSLSGFAWHKCHKKSKKQETPAKNEKPLAEIVVATSAKKETPMAKKANGWVYAPNAEIARSSRSREIARRKSLPGRLTLHQISRKIHQTNSANALKRMKAAKSKRDDSAKKLAAAQAKRKNTIKLLERVKKELVDAKEALDRKMKVSAEIAALDATTPQVQSKSLKLGPTQSETATAREISPRATTPQATTSQTKTIQTTTTRATTDVTTDATTEATTEEPTTAAQTTDDTRSGI